MALLWGNGRLLVGLMAYWQATRDAAVLAAARRLAAFLLGVREATKAPEVMARVEGQGAFGFICFTQLAEGLALLTRATGDGSYAAAGRRDRPAPPAAGRAALPRLPLDAAGRPSPPRGRGDAAMLAFAERLYGELVGSSDYTVDGGVLEYFGWGDPDEHGFPRRGEGGLGGLPQRGLRPRRLRPALAAAARGDGPRRVPGAGRAVPRQRLRPQPVRQRRLRLPRLLRPGHPALAQRDPLLVVLHDARLPGLPRRARPRRRREGRARWRSSSSRTWTSTGKAGPLRRRTPFGLTVGCARVRGYPGPAGPVLGAARRLARNGAPAAATRRRPLRVEARFAAGDRFEARFAPRLRLLTPKGRRSRSSTSGPMPCAPRSTAAPGSSPPTSNRSRLLRRALAGKRRLASPRTVTSRVDRRSGAARRHLRARRLPRLAAHELRPMGETPADEQKTIAFRLNYRRA